MVEIFVNGEKRPVSEPLTLVELLQQLGLAEARVAVAVNRRVIPRSEHPGYRLQGHDRVEIVRAIGGG
jgi:sulfur carrier protein